MTDHRRTAERYLAIWNEPDGERRRRLVERGWTEAARYVDPLMAGDGHAGIASMIEGVRAQFAGHAFSLRGEPDGHGRHVRFSWTLAAAGGQAVAGGTDIARLDEEGRFVEVIGFLDGSFTHG